jgi:hypothetical protein
MTGEYISRAAPAEVASKTTGRKGHIGPILMLIARYLI